MIYCLCGHDRATAVGELLVSLLPDETHKLQSELLGGEESSFLATACFEGDAVVVCADVCKNGKRTSYTHRAECVGSQAERTHALTYAVREACYRALLPHLEVKPAWGLMTGVKPTKPVRLAVERGLDPAQAESYLQQGFDVDARRSRLAATCALQAIQSREQMSQSEAQLYISIPFCPSKCLYCSFVSNDVKRFGQLVDPYLRVLHSEIKAAVRAFARTGVHVGSLYIGGGTPTTLSAMQLDELLTIIHAAFDLSHCREMTVEAGRPETITVEKMQVCARHGVDRVSVNPQSMHDHVLEQSARPHTADDIKRALDIVRDAGSFAVNMDLIAGLPGDDDEGLLGSVQHVIELAPENITLHCMALKKGAPLRFGKRGQLRAQTIDACHDLLRQAGYGPYYMYRQKYMAGALENVGFCKPGRESFYNICMMEELGDVVALGAGGVSKLWGKPTDVATRIANPKYPLEYIQSENDVICRAESLSFQ